MTVLTAFAPAKVNLHLHVVGRRPDGYHLLDSLVVFADVGDRLSVSPGAGFSLSITGPFAAGLDAEADNLVLRAGRALAAAGGIEPTGHLVLEKNLPVASGIGGGSADAAAALHLLRAFWGLSTDLGDLAPALGADVPVCLSGAPSMMSGIGEIVAPAPALPNLGLVLVNPGVAVSTPAVFRARSGGFSWPAAFPAAGWTTTASLAASLRDTTNDLEAPARALVPAIGRALDSLAAAPGCLLARMSGSGATCFGIFASPEDAAVAAPTIGTPNWWRWGGGLRTAMRF